MSKFTKLLIVFVLVLFATSALGDAKEVKKGIEAYNVGDYAACLSMCMPDAEKGDPVAQFCIVQANGWGVPMNDVEAARLYRLAAEQGFLPAVNGIAYVNARGIGIPKDVIEGFMWYEIGAQLGDLDAVVKRDALAEKMSAEDITAATAKATAWMETHPKETLHAGIE